MGRKTPKNRARRGRVASVLVASALAFGLACDRGGSTSNTSVTRDSAGIAIVENLAPVWDAGTEWRVAEEPVLSIGVADGPEEYQLFRAWGARRLPGGDILVVNAGTGELRFFDSTGVYLYTVGRNGAGPGEYETPGLVGSYVGDSLLIADHGNDRMAVLGPRGEPGRLFHLQPVAGSFPGFVVGSFADGSLLVSTSPAWEGDPALGLTRDTTLYCRYDPTGALIDTLVRRPGGQFYGSMVAGRPVWGSPPFNHSGTAKAGADRWYYGSSDAFEIETYAPDGRLTRLIRAPLPVRPITAAIADEYRKSVLEESGRRPQELRRWRAEMPLPEAMPAYTSFVVDDDGNLWVSEYRLSGEPPMWAVFDPGGRFLGELKLPAHFSHPSQIGSDFMLAVGTWGDPLDIEQVRLYRLIKPEQ